MKKLLVFLLFVLLSGEALGQGIDIGGGGTREFPFGACNNATAAILWDTPTSNAATAACVTGSNTQKGVANFTTGQSAQVHFYLPAGVVNVATVLIWSSAQTTATGTWALTGVCTPLDGTATDDPAYGTFWAPSQSTSPGTANRLTKTTGSAIALPASCTGGDKWMHIKLAWTAGTATSFDAHTLQLSY